MLPGPWLHIPCRHRLEFRERSYREAAHRYDQVLTYRLHLGMKNHLYYKVCALQCRVARPGRQRKEIVQYLEREAAGRLLTAQRIREMV